ncbi:outer membrane protein assembly factor BamE [Pantoea sp. Nvir]|uniref:outer membrane protein assembly factor BamE n=1 Tax=Pantoea sp. Nvir TaxID=2576760 RepID=UPI0013591125|nr:outer membrane protein assembly factor BamE [Pantoea sp. Nvir]MXP66526.1 outer membrane protein assembly factor BamE [Pantoea sp. Nvir]CAJ0992292.1 Outer membrane protein assembly factor BamE [Pantoea sp. Nvir]
MRRNILNATAILLLMITTGCSFLERVGYHIDINQGNYLIADEVAKIHNGMTEQQVAYVLGMPMMRDPFGGNVWYYVFRREPGHKSVKQQTLTLTFDSNGLLSKIHNQDYIKIDESPNT